MKKRWPRIAVGSPLYNRLWDAALAGLQKAAQKYDSAHPSGARFSTLAWRWIEMTCLSALHHTRYEPSFDMSSGREHGPTDVFSTMLTPEEVEAVEEILAELEARDRLAATAYRLVRGNGWSYAQVAEYLATSKSTAYALVRRAETEVAVIARQRQRPVEEPMFETTQVVYTRDDGIADARGVWRQSLPRREMRRDWADGCTDRSLLVEDNGYNGRSDYARELSGDPGAYDEPDKTVDGGEDV